ncbi:uncharacterized protein FYW61_007951 [Anableps anableps]
MDRSGAAGSPSSASCDSLPAPADPVRLHPDPQNQEADRQNRGPGCPTGTPEPALDPDQNRPNEPQQTGLDPGSAQQELAEEPPSKADSTGPGTLHSEQKEPGGSAGPEPLLKIGSLQVLQNPKGSAEPRPGPSEVLTAGTEASEDPQDHQDPEDLHQNQNHQNPPENLAAGTEEISLEDLPPSSADQPGRKEELHASESLDLQNHLDPGDHQNLQDPAPHLHQQQTPPVDLQNHLSPVAPPLTIEAFCDQVEPRPLDSSSGEPKLCGYLQKQAGPLRAWKLRWFTYEEKKNQLFYYRTPQDVAPLGRVELSGATFTYPLKAESGTFHIKTPERTFILKVGGLAGAVWFDAVWTGSVWFGAVQTNSF